MSDNTYRDLWNSVLESPRGIAIPCDSRAHATTIASRMNHDREKARKESLAIFPEGDSRRGKSYFDGYTIRKREEEGRWTVIIEPLPKLEFSLL